MKACSQISRSELSHLQRLVAPVFSSHLRVRSHLHTTCRVPLFPLNIKAPLSVHCVKLPELTGSYSSSSKRLFSSSAALLTSSSIRDQVMAGTIPPPECLKGPANIPKRLLMGPGPSNAREEILAAMQQPLLGHLHPEFCVIMDDVREGIKYAFQTNNKMTFAVSGTGHSGMECALVNLLEPTDRLLVIEIGLWGQRAAEMGERIGANVKSLKVDLGKAMDLLTLQNAIESFRPHVVFACQGDSSTGVLQPLDDFGSLCSQHNCLLLVDTVASLAGAPFYSDKWQVDCVYSATQKALSAPPGLAPISFSERAVEKIKNRTKPVQSFYFDANYLANYWGCYGEARKYHHTAPISTVYACREALRLLAEEGIEQSVARHAKNVQLLYQGLADLGLELFVEDEELRLPCLTTVKVPEGVDWKAVQSNVMAQGIEIAGGLGDTVGKIWRIGTFGVNSSEEAIQRTLDALKAALGK